MGWLVVGPKFFETSARIDYIGSLRYNAAMVGEEGVEKLCLDDGEEDEGVCRF